MKKSAFAALTSAALLFGIASPASADSTIAYGAGVSTCSTYLSDRSQDVTMEYNYFSWAQGYLTRLNLFEAKVRGRATVNLVPNGFGVAQQISWINGYCATHGSTPYADAAYELYVTIRGLNGLTS